MQEKIYRVMSLPNSERVFNDGCDYNAAQLVRKWAHQRQKKKACFTKPLLVLVFVPTSCLIKHSQYLHFTHKENQWLYLFWSNSYACKNQRVIIIIHEKTVQVISSFQVTFSALTTTCPSYFTFSSPLYKHSVSSTSLQVWYFVHLNVLKAFDSSVPM